MRPSAAYSPERLISLLKILASIIAVVSFFFAVGKFEINVRKSRVVLHPVVETLNLRHVPYETIGALQLVTWYSHNNLIFVSIVWGVA